MTLYQEQKGRNARQCHSTIHLDGYVINTETYKVEIKANQTTTQAIKNTEPTGEITLSKTDKYTGNSKRVNGTIHHRDATLGVMLLAFLGIS